MHAPRAAAQQADATIASLQQLDAPAKRQIASGAIRLISLRALLLEETRPPAIGRRQDLERSHPAVYLASSVAADLLTRGERKPGRFMIGLGSELPER